MRPAAVVTCFALGLAVAPAARAADPLYPPAPDLVRAGGKILEAPRAARILRLVRDGGVHGRPRRSTAAHRSALRFDYLVPVAREVAARVSRQLSTWATDPALYARAIGPDIASGNLQRRFGLYVRLAGGDDRDLGDVTTGFLIWSWQVVNRQTLTDPRGARAIGRRVTALLARSRAVRGYSEREATDAAETLMLGAMTMWAGQAYGDDAKDAAIAKGWRRVVKRRTGLDLGRLDYTPSGFR